MGPILIGVVVWNEVEMRYWGRHTTLLANEALHDGPYNSWEGD